MGRTQKERKKGRARASKWMRDVTHGKSWKSHATNKNTRIAEKTNINCAYIVYIFYVCDPQIGYAFFFLPQRIKETNTPAESLHMNNKKIGKRIPGVHNFFLVGLVVVAVPQCSSNYFPWMHCGYMLLFYGLANVRTDEKEYRCNEWYSE